MGEIRRITISGFRGINTPALELDFKEGKSDQSMMIYGRNGSGKSSIVDAWEWLCSGKIEHLAREGAGPQSYPHKESDEGQTYIEVEFTNPALGTIKIEYDPSKVTQPLTVGNLSALREQLSYPCHLRYRDLSVFVYERKAEKYKILSRLMGFEHSLNIQNDLQTCAGQLAKKLEELQKQRDKLAEEYKKVSGEEPRDNKSFISIFNTVLKPYEITSIKESTEVNNSLAKLKEQIDKDEKSKQLSQLKELQGIINKLYPLQDVGNNISEFQKDLVKVKQNEEEVSNLILLDLYERGKQAIESLEVFNKCPLCDRPYEGNLLEHIQSKQSHLEELKGRRDKLDFKRKQLHSSITELIPKIKMAASALEEKELDAQLGLIRENLKIWELPLYECRDMLSKKLEDIDKDFDFEGKVITKEYKSLLESEDEIREKLSKQIEILEKDASRTLLVDDYTKLKDMDDKFKKWSQLEDKLKVLKEINESFEKIRADYVEDTKRTVQASFDTISSDLAEYFNILERDSKVIADPKIKLISEKDKAVELEVLFGGEPVSPAYKILSESQLNSFGLSIFLASIKNFNSNFKFVILDDVINSFDIYKRPRVIDLLEGHFKDYQILLLTHDSIWLDRLQRSFPKWIRKRFVGWDYTLGPRVEPGKNSYEQIEEFLANDKPGDAGRIFGAYLEWILQSLCENFEAQVKYNRRNEYTLSELFQSLHQRVKKKLKESNSVVKLISKFETETGFRNFCAHWKEPETPYSSKEIKEIVENWKQIENMIECSECLKFPTYQKVNGYENILCPCTKHNLKSEEYYK